MTDILQADVRGRRKREIDKNKLKAHGEDKKIKGADI
jgi:hypothetical protein